MALLLEILCFDIHTRTSCSKSQVSLLLLLSLHLAMNSICSNTARGDYNGICTIEPRNLNTMKENNSGYLVQHVVAHTRQSISFAYSFCSLIPSSRAVRKFLKSINENEPVDKIKYKKKSIKMHKESMLGKENCGVRQDIIISRIITCRTNSGTATPSILSPVISNVHVWKINDVSSSRASSKLSLTIILSKPDPSAAASAIS